MTFGLIFAYYLSMDKGLFAYGYPNVPVLFVGGGGESFLHCAYFMSLS